MSIDKKNIENTSIKFKYKITIKNEGTITGSATEIKDYIPDGLEFYESDNSLWKKIDNNIVITDQTKDIMLEPGQSVDTEIILSWIGRNRKLGTYENKVEISNDYNDSNVSDIDSTPNNDINEENDMSNITISLESKNKNMTVYILIGAGTFVLVICTIILLKKFVV